MTATLAARAGPLAGMAVGRVPSDAENMLVHAHIQSGGGGGGG